MANPTELPPLVRRCAEKHLPADAQLPRGVRLTQVGEMQVKPGRWLSFRAMQDLSTERVEFAWRARFRVAPLVSLRVVDWYRDGDGGLEGRVWGLVPVVRARGPETARAEAMRYLSELAWVPHALIANDELEWRELDGRTVEVATRVASSRVAVRLQLDAAGDIVGVSADARPRLEGKRTIERPFRGSFGEYRELGGLRVPTTAEVAWELPDGAFPYFRGRVTSLELE